MLSAFDYAVLVFYFALMFGVGFIFRGVNRNLSDYFRGSGSMLWWVVGASAFMQQISAFAFTGVAGKAYIHGSIVTAVFFANAAGYFFNYLWTARRFRQMKMITPIEGVRERFGAGNEQFFTWLQMPVNLIGASIWMHGLGIFVAAVFQFDLFWTIIATGLIVVTLSVIGGSWAVLTSDFVQMLVLMLITVVAGVMILWHPAIEGVGGLVKQAPRSYFHWTAEARPAIVWLWVIGVFTKQLVGLNSMMDSSRYLCALDGRHASRGALLAAGLMLLGPLIWFLPPMATGIIAPDLGAIFPRLQNPGDASYVFGAAQVLPLGMMGLLLSGIFSATMTSIDGALNRNAGIFVKNYYQPILAPAASEANQLRVGKVISAVFGGVIISVSLGLSYLKNLSLYDIMLFYGSLVALPTLIPLTLCHFVKRTPSWSGWSTVLLGFAVSLCVAYGIDPQLYGQWLGFDSAMTAREVNDFRFFAGVLCNVAICTTWFLCTSFFYPRSPAAYQARVEAFFERMRTPVIPKTDHSGHERLQYMTIAAMCGLFAAFILIIGLIIPQPTVSGRLAYLAIVGVLGMIGLALWNKGRKSPLASAKPDGRHPD